MYICCLVSSLSFQKIGGFALDIVKSMFLFFLYSSDNLSIFLDLFKKTLVIKIQSSVVKLFSLRIVIVFLVFLAKQLSISSETL